MTHRAYGLDKLSVVKYTRPMKGWIYKISHKDEATGENKFPSHCYIGQTRVTIKDRWNQHRNACLQYKASKDRRRRGKHADLYEAMSVIRISNFIIEEIAEYECEDENELVTILEQAEASFIDKYDSINSGWNAKRAARSSVRNPNEESLYQIAKENNIAYNSLRHRIKNLNETTDEAIQHLKQKGTELKINYQFKRQSFSTIEQLAKSKIHNPNKLSKKTIEQRIRKLRKQNKLTENEDHSNRRLNVILTDDIFVNSKQSKISVATPDGDKVTGTKKHVHSVLKQRYPELVPETYQTVIARSNKSNWSIEQAFGLDYPPDLKPVKKLIEEEGYVWADDEPPNFVAQDGKPVVMERTKEIFVNQSKFADTYGLPKDMVSDYLKHMTPEEFLESKGLKP